MSNKVKINGKTSMSRKEVMATMSKEEVEQLDQVADKVRQLYAEEDELKEKMLELAGIHIEAHAASINHWDKAMAKAVEVINTGRQIYTGSWEGRLLWLERAAEVLRIDVARSSEYSDGEIRLYWADVDKNIILKDGKPEVEIETLERLRGLCLVKVGDEQATDAEG